MLLQDELNRGNLNSQTDLENICNSFSIQLNRSNQTNNYTRQISTYLSKVVGAGIAIGVAGNLATDALKSALDNYFSYNGKDYEPKKQRISRRRSLKVFGIAEAMSFYQIPYSYFDQVAEIESNIINDAMAGKFLSPDWAFRIVGAIDSYVKEHGLAPAAFVFCQGFQISGRMKPTKTS